LIGAGIIIDINRMAIVDLKIRAVEEETAEAGRAAGISLRGGIWQEDLPERVHRMTGITSAIGR